MRGTYDLNGFADDVAHRARDAAYVAVGLGILGFQKAQARRHELAVASRAGREDERLNQLRSDVETGARQLAAWGDMTAQLFSASLAPLEAQLPKPAREVAGKARDGLCAISAQLRQVASSGT